MNLVWLRNDLRLEDNPALYHACNSTDKQSGNNTPSVYCVFAITPKQWQNHDDGEAKIAFIRSRLIEFAKELESKAIPLKLIVADAYSELPKKLLDLAHELNATSLWFNHEYPLNEKKRDQAVTKAFEKADLNVHTFHGDVVQPPGSVLTQNGDIYKVFTPFARQWRKQITNEQLTVLDKPRKQQDTGISSDNVESVWKAPANFRNDLWPTTTKAIHKKLIHFNENTVDRYKELRDFPAINGTSTLSPYLMVGAVSVRQCIQATQHTLESWLESTWVNELIWREFYRHLTDAYPHLSRSENFKVTKAPIPWEDNEEHWQAWREGRTGFPIVDAAMKQLLQTGWMHNRLRMIVAAFLTKLLLIDWRKGEAFFMAHLVDADYCSNNGGWQWAASTGADAAPYFRIFNPLRQSEKFDPDGKFIRKLLPELAALDDKSIHNPNSTQRKKCGYPEPIIDYKFARERALDGYAHAMGK